LRFEVWDYDYGDVEDYLGTGLCSVKTLLDDATNGTLSINLNDGMGGGISFGTLRVHVVQL